MLFIALGEVEGVEWVVGGRKAFNGRVVFVTTQRSMDEGHHRLGGSLRWRT